jgi:hypothetical protein
VGAIAHKVRAKAVSEKLRPDGKQARATVGQPLTQSEVRQR